MPLLATSMLVALLSGAVLPLARACPLGFDKPQRQGGRSDDIDPRERCFVGVDADGEPAFDETCLKAARGGFWAVKADGGASGVSRCDWFWGGETDEDTWTPGFWDKMTGEAGEEYWGCYAQEKEELAIRNGGFEAMAAWPDAQWHDERLKIDRKCVPKALCEFEHSEFGWCSAFFIEHVLPDCGEDDYRSRFCTEVCTPPLQWVEPPPGHPQASAALDTAAQEEEDELPEGLDGDLRAPKSPAPAPTWQTSKCPAKRFAFKAKEVAKDVTKSAASFIRRLLPGLLPAPQPPASEELSGREDPPPAWAPPPISSF